MSIKKSDKINAEIIKLKDALIQSLEEEKKIAESTFGLDKELKYEILRVKAAINNLKDLSDKDVIKYCLKTLRTTFLAINSVSVPNQPKSNLHPLAYTKDEIRIILSSSFEEIPKRIKNKVTRGYVRSIQKNSPSISKQYLAWIDEIKKENQVLPS